MKLVFSFLNAWPATNFQSGESYTYIIYFYMTWRPMLRSIIGILFLINETFYILSSHILSRLSSCYYTYNNNNSHRIFYYIIIIRIICTENQRAMIIIHDISVAKRNCLGKTQRYFISKFDNIHICYKYTDILIWLHRYYSCLLF